MIDIAIELPRPTEICMDHAIGGVGPCSSVSLGRQEQSVETNENKGHCSKFVEEAGVSHKVLHKPGTPDRSRIADFNDLLSFFKANARRNTSFETSPKIIAFAQCPLTIRLKLS